ncbi:hypothetical protein [Virgibacillus sp. DJP39]|uniref:hypothetical protein n=1 Tax=Virgibacillus sp. DJP39 TaxID=3409790 RepID=UPI003BB5DD20
MSGIDIAMVFYVIFMIGSATGCIFYGSFMMRETGSFLQQMLIAGTINLSLGIFAILGWFLFSWGVNEFMLNVGLSIGAGLLVIGETVLFVLLFLKRKQWLQQDGNGV